MIRFIRPAARLGWSRGWLSCILAAGLALPAVAQADMRLIGLMAIPGAGLAWLFLQGIPADAPPPRRCAKIRSATAAISRINPAPNAAESRYPNDALRRNRGA